MNSVTSAFSVVARFQGNHQSDLVQLPLTPSHNPHLLMVWKESQGPKIQHSAKKALSDSPSRHMRRENPEETCFESKWKTTDAPAVSKATSLAELSCCEAAAQWSAPP